MTDWGVMMKRGAGILLLGLGLALAMIFAFGLDRVWGLFGPADLGPVAFESLERRASPNDALACPAGLCRAQSDLTPPVYAVSAAALKQALARVVASEPNVEQVENGPASDRFIQRSRWMRYPDTIVVRYISRGEGQSTLALYSRSQIGHSDLGVNRARLQRWLEKLSREASVAK